MALHSFGGNERNTIDESSSIWRSEAAQLELGINES